MIELILSDAAKAPHLFLWNGPIDRALVDRWVARHGWTLPADLLEFWSVTGGGELFETEFLLKPLQSEDGTEEIVDVTKWLRKTGRIDDDLVVFHEGLAYTAIRRIDKKYVCQDSEGKPLGEFDTLDAWYNRVLRAEYAERYGLPTI